MSRYIDVSNVHIPKGFFDDLNVPKLLSWLESQPTTDVEEVRHGQYEKTAINITLLTQECSICKERGAVGDYCMWCGAKMDKEKEK